MYKLIPAEQAEYNLLFRLDENSAERHGAIGIFRADFGKKDNEFWYTWFDTDKELKTPKFQGEFDKIVNLLRVPGEESLFVSRTAMRDYCEKNKGLDLKDRGCGYKICTKDYSYYIRCHLSFGDYDIYIFAFDNRFLRAELAGQHDLPGGCFSTLPSSGELIFITRGTEGYFVASESSPDASENRSVADCKNRVFRVTQAQEAAMLAGGLFGWDVPAAKPWNYYQDGTPRRLIQQEGE